jgi:hypothetical protein
VALCAARGRCRWFYRPEDTDFAMKDAREVFYSRHVDEGVPVSSVVRAYTNESLGGFGFRYRPRFVPPPAESKLTAPLFFRWVRAA